MMSLSQKRASSTLKRPPEVDLSKAPIENALELITLSDVGADIYTNARFVYLHLSRAKNLDLAGLIFVPRELWHPPGARGIYGGAVIAQCLAAAQKTIPPSSAIDGDAMFLIHSMHCYFVLPGDSSIPILYYVERVREGKSFMTRTVQARQRGRCIFTTTCSFMREGSGGKKTVDHEWGMPDGVADELETILMKEENADTQPETPQSGPFVGHKLKILNQSSSRPYIKRNHQWLRARGNISTQGGRHAHLNALAYMTDSYFIGFVPLAHGIPRHSSPLSNAPSAARTTSSEQNSSSSETFSKPKISTATISTVQQLKKMAELEKAQPSSSSNPAKDTVGMLVSLDHTIYFHRPRDFRADEWMFTEIETPWAGDGRGLVMQRIWNRNGRLVATCVQEGLVRLNQNKVENSKL